MKRIISIFIVLIISVNYSYSQNFKELTTIKVNTNELKDNVPYQSTQFVLKTKQSTDYIFTFNITDIIKSYISKISKEKLNSAVIVFINKDGQTLTTTYNEFDSENTRVPAVITLKKAENKMGDSITIQEVDGDIDLSELDETFSHFATRTRVGLQISSLDKKTLAQLSKDATLVFPNDMTTDRWLSEITEIKIYIFE